MAVTHALLPKEKAKGGELFKKALRAILKRSPAISKSRRAFEQKAASVLRKASEEIIIRYGNSIFVLSDSFSIKHHYAHILTNWKNIRSFIAHIRELLGNEGESAEKNDGWLGP